MLTATANKIIKDEDGLFLVLGPQEINGVWFDRWGIPSICTHDHRAYGPREEEMDCLYEAQRFLGSDKMSVRYEPVLWTGGNEILRLVCKSGRHIIGEIVVKEN